MQYIAKNEWSCRLLIYLSTVLLFFSFFSFFPSSSSSLVQSFFSPESFFSSLIDFRPYPLNTSSELFEGDLKTGSNPDPVFGKAITSLILFVSHSIAISRSNPSAIPPCGGAPNLSAWSRCENLPISSSSNYSVSRELFRREVLTLRTSFMIYSCRAASWTRTLPPPISWPLRTRS